MPPVSSVPAAASRASARRRRLPERQGLVGGARRVVIFLECANIALASRPFITIADRLRAQDCEVRPRIRHPPGVRPGGRGGVLLSVQNPAGVPPSTTGNSSASLERLAETGQLARPSSVAVGPDGTIAVADTGNDRIRVFDANGTLLSAYGRGTLGRPASVEMGPSVTRPLPTPAGSVPPVPFRPCPPLVINVTKSGEAARLTINAASLEPLAHPCPAIRH